MPRRVKRKSDGGEDRDIGECSVWAGALAPPRALSQRAPSAGYAGFFVSLATITASQLLPKLDGTKAFWMRTVGTEIFRR
jgi:hypothetical protein